MIYVLCYFLSDLIGHYLHHINDRCKCTQGIGYKEKVNIFPQRLEKEKEKKKMSSGLSVKLEIFYVC